MMNKKLSQVNYLQPNLIPFMKILTVNMNFNHLTKKKKEIKLVTAIRESKVFETCY